MGMVARNIGGTPRLPARPRSLQKSRHVSQRNGIKSISSTWVSDAHAANAAVSSVAPLSNASYTSTANTGRVGMLRIAASSSSSSSSSVMEAGSSSQTSRKGTGPVVVVDNYDSFTYNLCQVPTADVKWVTSFSQWLKTTIRVFFASLYHLPVNSSSFLSVILTF